MFFSWWRKLLQKPSRTPYRKRPSRKSVRLELLLLEDRLAPAVTALSAADPSLISDTAAGNVQGPASVSQDGRYVVYTNSAANLAESQVMDSKSAYNVFLYDRVTAQTTLVSYAA